MKTIFAESVEGRRASGLALPVDDDAPRAAQMLPETLDRVLYLDPDMLILQPLHFLIPGHGHFNGRE